MTHRPMRSQQAGVAVMLSSVFLTTGLLLTSLYLQTRTTRELYQVENQIRLEQAAQIEQAGQNLAAAVMGKTADLNAMLSKPGVLLQTCLAKNTELPAPSAGLMTVTPPNFKAIGGGTEALAVEIDLKMIAAPASICASEPAGTNWPAWVAGDIANTRLKYQTTAKIGCSIPSTQGNAGASSTGGGGLLGSLIQFVGALLGWNTHTHAHTKTTMSTKESNSIQENCVTRTRYIWIDR